MPPLTANRRDVLLSAINHEDSGRVPIDFGSTGVTGIHASCVAALREHYGLEKRPVKIHEPFQMLALVEEDLQNAMGIDVTGVFARKTMFGFPIDQGWKPWKFNGLDVQIPLDFNVTIAPNGDTLIYPEGDMSVPPSGRMPQGGYFFDAIIRQKPIEESKLNPEDNMEEFKPVTEQDVTWLAKSAKVARASGRAVLAGFGGTALGDIALVPAPFLKDPKGIRDVAEWYMSTRSRRGYIHEIFERECTVAIGNLQRIHAAVGDDVDAVFTCGTDLGTQSFRVLLRPHVSRTVFPLLQTAVRLDSWPHYEMESLQAHLRIRRRRFYRFLH
jgi:hypothetical protein